MLQQDEPDDFVIATGETQHRPALRRGRLRPGGHRRGRTTSSIDDAFKRPAEVDLLVGDYGKAERELGWEPRTDFEAADPPDGRRRPEAAWRVSTTAWYEIPHRSSMVQKAQGAAPV